MRGAQAEQSFGNLVSNQLALGPSTLEVRAAVTLMVPLGGPVGQVLGFNAAGCQCLRNGSASAQRETGMASKMLLCYPNYPSGENHKLHQSQSCPHLRDWVTFYTHKLYESQKGWLSSHLFQHGFMGGIPTVL